MHKLSSGDPTYPLPNTATTLQVTAEVDALIGEERNGEALSRMVAHLETFPRDVDVLDRLGNFLSTNPSFITQYPSTRILTAVARYARALALEPGQDKHRSMNLFYVASYLDPALGLGHYYVGKELLETGHVRLALAFLERACSEDLNCADCQLQQGIALVRLEHYAEAIPLLRQAINPGATMQTGFGEMRLSPVAVDARFYLGYALIQLNPDNLAENVPEALEHFFYVQDNRPHHWRAFEMTGQVLPSLINESMDEQQITKIVEDTFNDLMEALRLRRSQDAYLDSEGPHADPINDFARTAHHLVLHIYADTPVVQRHLLLHVMRQMRQLAQRDPNIAQAINNSTGRNQDVQNLRELALAKFTEWAMADEAAGRPGRALELLSNVHFLDPDDRPLCFDLIRLCMEVRDWPQALTYLNALARGAIVPPTVPYNICLCQILLGNWEEALSASRLLIDQPVNIPGWPAEIPGLLRDILAESQNPREIRLTCRQILERGDCHEVALSVVCMLLAKHFVITSDRERSEFFENLARSPVISAAQRKEAMEKLS